MDPAAVSAIPRAGKITKCRVCNIHDGDTFTIIYFIKKHTPFKIKIRMSGIDAPEINSKNKLEIAAGKAVTQWLCDRIAAQKYWWVLPQYWEKYGGRILGKLYPTSDMITSINEEMINKGLAISYKGGKKEPWGRVALKNIIENAVLSSN